MRHTLFALLLSLFGVSAQAQSLVLINDVSDSMNASSLDTQFQAYATLLAGPMRHQLEGQHVEVIIFGKDAATVSSGSVDDAIAAFILLSKHDTRTALINDVFSWPAISTEQGSGPNARGGMGPRSQTCVGGVLNYVRKLVPTLPAPIIVDISGDGKDNCGLASLPKTMSQDLLAAGVVINSLPMGSNDVAAWYEANVTTGFQITAWSADEFEEALYEKLMTEISMLTEKKVDHTGVSVYK